MSSPNATEKPPPGPSVSKHPAIEVEGLHKKFRIPIQRVDSLKERIVRPFSSREYRELRALDGVSFEIRQGEFFGIVGRNGSGKSTLLKLLASIYRADKGTIRMAGRLAPFIELGVGFNPEMTARENVVLNGVMMGLTPQEARNRLDAVVEFAELGEFVDLKLKNYSSGMLVRLGFSLMMEVDADILLIDEVLAVGDASFQQKCADAFREMKGAGKTIVLVTHEMPTVEQYCHRAMLIDGGKIQHLGDPGEVGRHYLQLNFEGEGQASPSSATDMSGEVVLLDAWIEGPKGERLTSLEHGDRIRMRLELEVKRDISGLDVGFILANADGISISQFGADIEQEGTRAMVAGERIKLESTLANPLAPGHYFIRFGVNRTFEGGIALYVHEAIDFIVYGGSEHGGLVSLGHDTTVEVER
jgi:ABC-type polysaccharide/polyol phosphate transport system ATPase subunit